MSTRVMYNGNRLIPAPFIAVSKQYETTGDSTQIGSKYSITINGTICSFKGSPSGSGTFHTVGGFPPDETVDGDSRLGNIQRKQESIRSLFSQQGLQFEVQSADGQQSIKCNPRIVSIVFPQGQHFNTSTYSIVLDTDILYPGQEDYVAQLGLAPSGVYVSTASENWSIDTNEEQVVFGSGGNIPTYVLTHNLSAVGKAFYDDTGTLAKPAWQQARDYVHSKKGERFNPTFNSGEFNLHSFNDTYQAFNHIINENVDELGGAYALVETWLMASSGSAVETLNVSTNNNGGRVQVNIDGNIAGLELRDSTSHLITKSKWDSAKEAYLVASGMAFGRAQAYSENTSLNINPLSQTTARNPVTGTINYSLLYDDRPSNIVSGSLSEVIGIRDGLDGDIFAQIPVLGRAVGPVLQDIGTRPALNRSLNIEVAFKPDTLSGTDQASIKEFMKTPLEKANTSGDIRSLIQAAQPTGSQVFRNQPQSNWNPTEGSFSYSIDWVYEE